ncbi:MAG: major capsid protein [Microviridae sp.]|nr:MAG: major capsid protein [Microviridae sp.]
MSFNIPNQNHQSVMSHKFSEVPHADIPRSTFDRSHGYKTTFDAGLLIPILVDEVLPGDTFNVNVTGFARLATPIFPIMDNMFLDTHYFAVPVRLLWSNWQKFHGEQENPGDSTDYTVPQIESGEDGFIIGSLFDYFGLPTDVSGISVSALYSRAYNLIYNEWYRDENLIDSLVVDKDDGPDTLGDYQTVRRRGKRHDYFTSALPWPQKGVGVSIPLGTVAPVVSNNTQIQFRGVGTGSTRNLDMSSVSGANKIGYSGAAMSDSAGFGANTGLYTDLSTATAATINSLRQAFQIQRIYEKDSRSGSRYIEMLKAHFGVTSPDYRLQRPEYLGGGSVPVNISPIPQTSSTNVTTPQGNLSAIGTASLRNGFTQSFTEHCIIMGIASVRADLTYQQGIDRMFSRKTRFDYYLPALSAIGEQAVLQKEIFADGNPTNDEKVFGYQERYAEYRYKPSKITGLFRSSAAGALDAWHLSQTFSTAPVLDQTFIEENPPVDRVIAVPSQPHFLYDSYISMRCTRPMPVFGVPGLIDHF